MEYHPAANIFRVMDKDEFERLKADIKANGLREAIWTHDGKIIDGRHRFEACTELNIAPTFREWSGEGSLIQFVVSLNLSRRHLDSSQRAALSIKIRRLMEAEARERQGARNDIGQKFDGSCAGRADQITADMLGTNRQYISDVKKLETVAPELVELVADGTIKIPHAVELSHMSTDEQEEILDIIESGEAKTPKAAQRIIQEEAQAHIPPDLPRDISERALLICGTIEEDGCQIADESIDAIITAPPRSHLEAYEQLATLAARVLRPGGSLLCIATPEHLPAVMAAFSAQLAYHWTMASYVPSGSYAMHKINASWQPVLWFTKGTYKGHWTSDVIEPDSGRAALVQLTLPGQTILDPFMSSDVLTGLAALSANRRFIGMDSRLSAIEAAYARLQSIQQEHAAAD